MITWPTASRSSPIGVDIGSRTIKLLQFDRDCTAVREAARVDLPSVEPSQRDEAVIAGLNHAREGAHFRGRDAVFCLSADDLFVQNIRVAPAEGEDLERMVVAEAAGRLPFPSTEAEIRFFEAGDVRQGETLRREVILLVARRQAIQRMINWAEQAGLRLQAIDVEPAALWRAYARQFRRDKDQQRRMLFVSMGASSTKLIVADNNDVLFVKYIEVGGRHLDEAVARHLQMSPREATALRRLNGDRRAEQRDPEVTRSLQEASRAVLERLGNEISLCLRYYSVTFRGQPLSHAVLGGGEATEPLVEWLKCFVNMPCELGNPLRAFERTPSLGRAAQWDVAAGLALRELP